MEQTTQTQAAGRQNRLARDLETRTTTQRVAEWKAPERSEEHTSELQSH